MPVSKLICTEEMEKSKDQVLVRKKEKKKGMMPQNWTQRDIRENLEVFHKSKVSLMPGSRKKERMTTHHKNMTVVETTEKKFEVA
ncbi:hypothetical protein FACS189472_17790 [Alphaproteobacteria bacterium]|nr:hypothetical protein FACS189472_17790 [Alphaproteobacteria bacterium]